LAADLGIDRTVMTYVIDDLVAADLVQRQPNPADRRQRRIVATVTGRRVLRRLERRVRAAEDEVLGALTAAQREALCSMLYQVACDVRAVDPEKDVCEVAADWIGAASPAEPRWTAPPVDLAGAG
jgi:DNA-binding MarR family transcriptional regulator